MYFRGIHLPTEKTHSKQDVFFCLRKFATPGSYTQERLGKKKNLFLVNVNKVDEEQIWKTKKFKQLLFKVLFRVFHYNSLVLVVLSIKCVLLFCVYFICTSIFYMSTYILYVHIFFICQVIFFFPKANLYKKFINYFPLFW